MVTGAGTAAFLRDLARDFEAEGADLQPTPPRDGACRWRSLSAMYFSLREICANFAACGSGASVRLVMVCKVRLTFGGQHTFWGKPNLWLT